MLDFVNFHLVPAFSKLASEFNYLFFKCADTLKGIMFNVKLQNDVKTIFCRNRNMVFALRDAVYAEIDRLVKLKIYESVDSSD